MKELIVECPWHITVPRKTKKDKKVTLNLNTYRNLHHSTNNEAKVIFTELMGVQLEGKVLETPVTVTIQVYKPSKRILDKGNVYSVSSKFLYDALTSYGCWTDDNDEYVKTETILPTLLDPEKDGKIVFTFKTIGEEDV